MKTLSYFVVIFIVGCFVLAFFKAGGDVARSQFDRIENSTHTISGALKPGNLERELRGH